MDVIIEFIKNLTNADWIMAHGGLALVALIVFAETGLFVGFFLPGDSLLFIAGLILANSTQAFPFDGGVVDLIFWMAVIVIAGIVGNYIGYWFGKKSGPYLYQRKDSWIFKKKHLLQAEAFYKDKGGFAIVMARFLPIVRTFAPIVAGMVNMDRAKFSLYNVVGSFAWVVSLMFLGYVLGSNEWVKNNLEYIIIGIVLITTGPVLIKMIFGKHKPKEESTSVE